MKKAFIAAPLLGTFIFLACIAFVVNLSNTEKLASSQVVNDAYHNRLVSLLEVYRTDLASIFREGIIRTTEYFLMRQGWNEFDLNQNAGWFLSGGAGSCVSTIAGGPDCSGSTDRDACAGQPGCSWLTEGIADQNSDGKVSYEELRFVKCDNLRALTSQIICSLPKTVDAGGAGLNYAYGLPQWMSKICGGLDCSNPTIPFEGMTFDIANRDAMKVFLPNVSETDETKRQASINAYQEHCLAMMKGSVFDCNNFAKPVDAGKPFRCCKAATTWNQPCAPEDVVPGCEDGTFFLNVSLNNTLVYPAMPRLNASDGRGNQIRSGAIGESDFLLPINYPLFRYYNYAFGVYKQLAYGDNYPAGYPTGDQASKNGVINGLCAGGSDCASILPDYGGPGFGNSGAEGDVKAGAESALFNHFETACNSYSSPATLVSQGLDAGDATGLGLDPLGKQMILQASSTGTADSDSDYAPCTDRVAAVAGGTAPVDALPYQMASIPVVCTDAGLYCAYYHQPSFKFEFKDFDPAYQVDANKQNFFRWSASPFYVP